MKKILPILLIVLFSSIATAQQGSGDQSKENKTPDEKQRKLFADFTKLMSGSKLVGNFTVDGQDMSKLRAEEYHIKRVTKEQEENLWAFATRIKYGDHDLAVTIPITILWAGDTPVITVSKLTIPGLGTFDARVIIHNNKYAGTWRHDDVGGLLFGKIVPDAAEEKPDGDAGDGRESGEDDG